MKILLVRHHNIGNINTRLPESVNRVQGIYPPLGIAYIASVLENLGHEVDILDSQALNLTLDETKKMIEKFNPDIVGVTSMTSTTRGAFEVAKISKEVSGDIITVLGGPNLSVYPKETLSHDFVDFGVVGEGEIVMPKLIFALEDKMDVEKIDGLVYKQKKVVKFKPPKNYVKDLNSLPFPARHLLPNHKYFSIISKQPFTTMIISRGCPFKCGYCFKKKFDNIVRFRDVENIIEEIEYCLDRWKFKEIWFYDDIFTLNKKLITNLCKEIIRRDLEFKWETATRVDFVDKNILRLMKKAGCYRIRYGIESGDQNIIDTMKKNINLSQARRAIKITKEVGMENFCFFMIGYPTETKRDIINTIKFSLNPDIDWAMFSNVVPYPKTDLFDLALKNGLLKDKEYWEKFILGLEDEKIKYEFPDIDELVKFAYKKFYFRPGFILRRISKTRDLKEIRNYLLGIFALMKFRMIPESV